MGRAPTPPQDTGERELLAQDPPWRSGGPAPPAATLRVLILALLWRGSLSRESGYSLMVPQSVFVREGLSGLIPCNFTYPTQYDTENHQAPLYGYWYKDPADAWQDPPVASTDPNRGVSQETQGRFWLVGDLTHRNCSLQIKDARRTDTGRYFFKVERGRFKYSYSSKNSYTEPQISVSDPPGPPNITGTLTRNGRPVPDAWGAEGDVVSLVTHEGDSLTLSCEAGNRPEVTLSWNRTNGTLSPGQGGAGRLELPNLSRGDTGEYWCWAEDPFGLASRALRVHMQGHPTAVLEGEGSTSRGPRNPRCPSPLCRSGHSSATAEPTRNWNLTGLRNRRTRPRLEGLLPRVRPTGPFGPVPGLLPTPPSQTHHGSI